ncbi:MAG: OmpA family protein [Brevinematales bacterium]
MIIIFFILFSGIIFASDWPIYKGNMYFTANNDHIIVKNNNLKWLYMAQNYVFNPVVSDGRVYFTDIDKIVYCLDEETGKLLWKLDLFEVSGHFSGKANVAGKVKYPIIKDNLLFISDATAIYCINKINGKIIWARAGLQEFEKTKAVIDGIYADPFVLFNKIFYGTRKNFIAREIFNGHVLWANQEIESYSGFPTFYDDKILTQSRDFKNNTFYVVCIDANTGDTIWKRQIENPLQIFPPVIYRGKIFIPSGKKLYTLSLDKGTILGEKEYEDYITSSPSFTDNEILLSIGNRKLTVISPETGNIKYEIDFQEKSSPYFATVNDQVYVAYNYTKRVGDKDIVFTTLKAFQFGEKTPLWEFYPPFPGAASQPVISRGTIFLPAGNYIYAIGTYYERAIVYGNDGSYQLAPEEQNQVAINDKLTPNPISKPTKDWDDEIEKKSSQSSEKSEPQIEEKKPDINISPPKAVEVLPDIKLEDLDVGESIIVPNIYFEFNQAYLRRESLSTLDKIVEKLKKNPKIKLEIQGHTDNIGSKEYNQKLSEKRANVVMEYLIKNGISPERLRAKGFGETKPIAPNSTEEGRSKNRRTEFLILEK